MSHYHESDDGFPNLEELEIHSEDDVSKSSMGPPSSIRHQDSLANRRIDLKVG